MQTGAAGKMSLFRPCIDLHDGKVKQIVGSTLSDSESTVKTNFVAQKLKVMDNSPFAVVFSVCAKVVIDSHVKVGVYVELVICLCKNVIAS